MTIGILLDDSLDRPDGVQQYVLTIGRWLSANNHQVHYITSRTNRTDIPNLHSISGSVDVKFNKNKLSIPKRAPTEDIQKFLSEVKLDVLHVQIPYSPMLGGRVLKLMPENIARVGTFHIMPSGIMSSVGTRLLGLLQKKNLRNFDVFTAVSLPAQEFARAYGIKTIVSPNVVDVAAYQSKLPQHDHKIVRVVFLGRLVERKGCHYLLKAVLKLRQGYPNLKFQVIIGGKGPMQASLEKFVKDNKLDDVIEFAGFIAEDQKPSFLAQADLAVFPSTTGESFGIVLIEAMAAGSVAVLAGLNPGYATVMNEDARMLVSPSDTQAFAVRLHDLIEDAEMRQQLHKAQQILLKQYDVQVVGPQMVDIYKSAIAKRSSKVA